MKKLGIYGVYLLGVLAFSGCGTHLPVGHFEGMLRRPSAVGYELLPIQIKLEHPESHIVTAQITSEKGEQMASVWLQRQSNKHLLLRLSMQGEHVWNLDFVPNKVTTDKLYCFESKQAIPPARLCLNKYQFFLETLGPQGQIMLGISATLFAQERRQKEPEEKEEKPRVVNLEEAVGYAYEKNYEAQVALEHMVQAQNATLTAWLNLIPHLTTNLIWNAQPSYVSAIATIQALTPFLLPSYWIATREAAIDEKIKHDVLLLTQGNIASLIEQTVYALQRDRKIAQSHELAIQALDNFRSAMRAKLESWPDKLPLLTQILKSSTQLKKVIQGAKSQFDYLHEQERYTLAQALGLQNPETVVDVLIGEELVPIEAAQEEELKELGRIAALRSFEADQVVYLSQIARLKKITMFFSWLDPSADQHVSLGFNLIGQVRIADSQERENFIKEKQLREIARYDMMRIAIDYNRAIANFHEMRATSRLEQGDYRKLLDEFLASESWNIEALQEAIKIYISSVIEHESNLANFRIARAKKDRLLLAGYYERMFLRMPSMNLFKTA